MTDAKPALNVAAHTPGPRARSVAEMLRVDHAGEYGAVQIYRGQRAVFDALPHKARLSGVLKDMEDGERHHLDTFDALLLERGVRPTVFSPLWNAAGFALGAATALMGEKAAMACTEAIEEVIEAHYREQAEELGDTEPDLRATIEQFREDEIGHKNTAVEHGAPEAFGHGLLSRAIKTGCAVAIRLSEKL